MKQSDIANLRLYNQRLGSEKFEDAGAVVQWMGALQAQDYAQAVWAMGARTSAPRLTSVEQAIEQRSMVLTWPMRGTLHAVPARDTKWMLKLTAVRMLAKDARRLSQLELDEAILERCRNLFYKVLRGGQRLTRAALMQLLEDAGVSPKGQRGYHILWRSAQEGLICQGPLEGKQQTFVLLDEWAPDARELSHEEALAEIAGRYFTSHGPATVQDFAWWTGLPMAEAKQGLELAKAGLSCETIDGTAYWGRTFEPGSRAGGAPQVQLLPGFDEYLLGYKDRSAVLAAEHAGRVVPGANGVFRPMVVAEGRVVGTWKRTVKKQAVDIAISLFERPEISQAAITGAARQYSDFLDRPLGAVTIEQGP